MLSRNRSIKLQAQPFILFGQVHIVTLLIILLTALLMTVFMILLMTLLTTLLMALLMTLLMTVLTTLLMALLMTLLIPY